MPKVIVLGLDGATFDLIIPWAEEGKLPNMKTLLAEGMHGKLLSTNPAHSAAAWTSFATGKNPGNHGVYSFRERSYTRDDFVSAKSRKCKAFWTLLSEAGSSVGVINVPITYPPEEVNGYMVSGLDTPSEESDYTFPQSLKGELAAGIGRYIIEADTTDMYVISNDKDRERFFSGILQAIEGRRKAMKYLLANHRVDFFAIAFMATDRVQHRCWKFTDPSHPHYCPSQAKQFGDMIPSVYGRLDDIIGEVLDMVGEETTLLVMSDHGMGPRSDRAFYLNNWLILNGYLQTVQVSGDPLVKRSLRRLKSFVIHTGLDFARSRFSAQMRQAIKQRIPSIFRKARLHESFASIDWTATRAYADELMGVIRINLKGREPEGTVHPGKEYEQLCAEITEKLMAIKDPQMGETVIAEVLKKEQIYQGPYLKEAPDMVIVWKDDLYSSQPSPPSSGSQDPPYLGRLDSEDTSRALMYHTSGAHRPHGIFMIRGPEIRKGGMVAGARIIDLAPTILYLMGQAIPKSMDGCILTEVFEEEFVRTNPPKYTDEDELLCEKPSVYSEDDKRRIAERLRGLGYIE